MMEKERSCVVPAAFILLLLVGLASSEVDVERKRSLTSFLQKLAPDNPELVRDLGWNASSDPCLGEWKGVVCNNRTRSVRTVALEGLPLGGTIDASLLCSRGGSISVVSLRSNGLTGSLPPDISNCSQLTHLYLSDNHLSGSLPSSLALLKNLKRLDLSNNSFSGELPRGLAKVSGLVTFLADGNALNGSVPPFDFTNLRQFNVSNNRLSGPLPQNSEAVGRLAFLGNPGLCGGPLEAACPPTPPPSDPVEDRSKKKKKKKKKKKVEKFVMYSGYILLSLAFALFVAYKFFKKRETGGGGGAKKSSSDASKKSSSRTSKKSSNASAKTSRSEHSFGTSDEQSPTAAAAAAMSLVVLKNPIVNENELKFERLLKAPAEMLGRGRFGTLYKVMMPNGTELAVKRIKDWTVSADEFQRRMERLDRAKHPRVLSAIAFYCSKQEKLVVYEYKPKGSLFKLLHVSQGDGNTFDWSSRLTVAAGIAEGLAFMHRDLQELGIGHGNLKSTNILLDANTEPLISEYGLLAVPKQSAAAAAVNANAGSRRRKSVNPANDSALKGDTYGFGVILLELLTGKVVQNTGADLTKWVNSMVREEWTVEVFDKALTDGGVSEGKLVRLLQVALKCIDPSLDSRPAVAEVAKLINAMREEDDASSTSGYDSPSI